MSKKLKAALLGLGLLLAGHQLLLAELADTDLASVVFAPGSHSPMVALVAAGALVGARVLLIVALPLAAVLTASMALRRVFRTPAAGVDPGRDI